MRRFAALVLVAALAVGIAACGHGDAEPVPTSTHAQKGPTSPEQALEEALRANGFSEKEFKIDAEGGTALIHPLDGSKCIVKVLLTMDYADYEIVTVGDVPVNTLPSPAKERLSIRSLKADILWETIAAAKRASHLRC